MDKPQRVHLIANSRSGKGAGATLPEVAAKICAELGAELVPYEIRDPHDLAQKSEAAVKAANADGGVVIAAGGDGTIRSVAQKAHGQPARFAVVPCGTFNFFARTHRIPEDTEQAFRLALTGQSRGVRLGLINGEIFLINASLGLYAKAIRERELRTSRWGRNRLVVILSTMMSFLSDHRLLNVDLIADGKKLHVRTPMIFIGNNALQLRDLSMSVARCMKRDLLAVVMMKPLRKREIVRILFRGLMRTVDNEERLDTFCAEELTIHTRKAIQTVALDGEILHMASPLEIKALPGILNMVLPPPEAAP